MRSRRALELVNMAEYARIRGCSRAAVTRAAQNGRIRLVAGLVNVAEADHDWPRTAGPPTLGVRSNGNGRMPADLDYWSSRAQHESVKTRLAELELAKEEGRLLDAEAVQREIFDCVRTLRERLQIIPNRLSGILACEQDEDKIHRILEDTIKQELADLAERLCRVIPS